MKKIILLLVLLTAVLQINAEESGQLNDNISWTLTDDGTLTISGTGYMPDFDHDTRPFRNFSEKILVAVIEDGVTSIGESTFYGCSGLTSVTIPESVTSIGNEAFYYCSGLTTIYSRPTVPPTCGTNVFDSSIYSSAVLYVPNNGNAFTQYSGLSPWNYFRHIRETTFTDGDDDYNPEWDVNKDGKFDIQDVTFLINKLVKK